jgi:uncharacterized protein (DUF2252 family)
VRDLVTSLKSRGKKDEIRLLDAAYWMKGCSSLGRLRYAVLLEVDSGDGKPDICFLDIKEAVKAAAPREPGAAMPRDNAERIVAGARALSPNLGPRMAACRLLGQVGHRPRADAAGHEDRDRRPVAGRGQGGGQVLARVVGDAHGRQMDEATRGPG